MKIIATLCIVHRDSKVLLGYKKKSIGQGLWNGFGGKVDPEETIEHAAIRETKEECGIDVLDPVKIGVMQFVNNDIDNFEVHLFKATQYRGDLVETNEMKPQWFEEQNIPFDNMWPDDKIWMPYFLDSKKFEAKFILNNQKTIVDYKIKETS